MVDLTKLAEAIEESGSDALEPLHPIVWEKVEGTYWASKDGGVEQDVGSDTTLAMFAIRYKAGWQLRWEAGERHHLREAFWSAAGEGALAGRLGHEAEKIKDSIDMDSPSWELWELAGFIIHASDFDNQAAVDALTEAVRNMEVASDR